MYSDDTLPSVPHFRISSSPLHIFVHKRSWIQTLPSEVLQLTAWTHLTMEKSDKVYGKLPQERNVTSCLLTIMESCA
jgi:hypothetical protein